MKMLCKPDTALCLEDRGLEILCSQFPSSQERQGASDNLVVYGAVESSHLPRGTKEGRKGNRKKEVPGLRKMSVFMFVHQGWGRGLPGPLPPNDADLGE